MSAKSADLGVIARELALDSLLGLYTIGVATHIPGVANKLPDALSRMWAPVPYAFPRELVGVAEDEAPPRGAAFWRTSAPRHRAGRAFGGRGRRGDSGT